jgi:uncharacterized membrane protein YedE/YeeE
MEWMRVALGFLLLANAFPLAAGCLTLAIRESWKHSRPEAFLSGFTAAWVGQVVVGIGIGMVLIGDWLVGRS